VPTLCHATMCSAMSRSCYDVTKNELFHKLFSFTIQTMKPALYKGEVTGWICEFHNMYNDILTSHCMYCKNHKRPKELDSLAVIVQYKRRGWDIYSNEREKRMALENGQTLEKHAEFFNNTKELVRDMDDFTLECHIRELGMIAFEARARVLAASEEKRQRVAKKDKEQREWIINGSGNEINVSDSIKGVKERKTRQTKAEKNLALLLSLGVKTTDAESLIAAAIRKSTGAAITSVSKPDDKVLRDAYSKTNVETKEPVASKPFVNPFAKK